MEKNITIKDIKGYERLYAITSCGKVWSYKSKKFLKPIITRNGYLRVNLSKNNVQKIFLIHRLVAEAYLDNPNNLPEINHKDEVKTHNWINNLEWCDGKYNRNYGTRTERASKRCMKKVICIETGEIFNSGKEAAEVMGLSRSHISQVCNKKRNTTGGYHFEFVQEEE